MGETGEGVVSWLLRAISGIYKYNHLLGGSWDKYLPAYVGVFYCFIIVVLEVDGI